MNRFFAGSNVKVAVPYMVDGVAVSDPTTASYRVLDQAGMELVAETPIVTPVGAEAEIEIPAFANELSPSATRGFREVQLTFSTTEGTFLAHLEYVLEATDLLRVGSNSFQTYGDAILTGLELTDITIYQTSDRESRMSALSNAYTNLTGFLYNYGSNSNVDLSHFDEYQINELPKRFLDRLKMAQVIEANEAMNSFSIFRRRQQGLMSETIGESSMMFRPEKVLMVPVTRRSMDLLRAYISWEMKIGRS